LKRIYIALILIIISAVVCILEFRFVTKTSEMYIKRIERIEREYNSDKYKALKLCNELSKDWEISASPMDTFLYHDYVDDISKNTGKLEILIKEEDTSAFETTCEEIKKQLESLKKSEIPSLENII